MVPTKRTPRKDRAVWKSSFSRHQREEGAKADLRRGAAALSGSSDMGNIHDARGPSFRRSRGTLPSTGQGMPPRRQDKLQSELRSLREEMEVIPQGRRRPPKHQAKQRTDKRKVLEAQDLHEFAVERDTGKRLRGARAAEEDEVIQGSLIFRAVPPSRNNFNTENQPHLSLPRSEKEEETLIDDDDDSDNDDVEDVDDEAEGDEYVSGDDEKQEWEAGNGDVDSPKPKRVSGIRRPRRKTRMYRMRSFKSTKMTERHGDALAAFAQGRNREAIDRLQSVARELPSAPQVYSSLGMVYEDMLRELRKRRDEIPISTIEKNGRSGDRAASSGETEAEHASVEVVVSEQLAIAKKAYGSYHIAALLCKKDFTCWVRAGDCAVSIAELHGEIMTLRYLSEADREHHRSEKQRWLSEAKNDYQTADAIQAPGIEIPAKLASVCMELGKLSEAMTILTDLKNRAPSQPNRRSAFEASYRAWLLYADLMLRIGYECMKWNRGDQSIGNSSFRRWLRRHATDFDWEERRLQALGKALEAAAGSKSSGVLTEWLVQRALDRSKAVPDLLVLPASLDQGDTNLYENEVSLLRQKHATELADFDKTTCEINIQANPVPTERRSKARDELLHRQENALKELQDEFGRGTTSLERDMDPSRVPQSTDIAANDALTEEPLMISASTKTVCAIASEMLRHLLLLKAYDGGRLVGEVVALYFKERASLFDKRLNERRAFEEYRLRRNSALQSFSTLRDTRDETVRDQCSDDESVMGLSDDDDLDGGPQEVLEALRNGCFPPEISVLYALCLVGEGGRDYVAMKHLEGIRLLEQESLSDMFEYATDTGVSYDARWTAFKRLRTAPLHRNAAFALVHDVLLACKRDVDLATRLSALFDAQVMHLSEAGLLCEPIPSNNQETMTESRVAVDKIATAAARFHLTEAELLVADSNVDKALELVLSKATTLNTVLNASWRVDSDGSVASSCVMIVETLARLFRFGISSKMKMSNMQDWEVWATTIGNAVSPLIGSSHRELPPSPVSSLPDVGAFPMSSTWLSGNRRALALCAYNLGVSMNVARFSGWEDQEFSTVLIRRRAHCSSHFGIALADDIVSGLLVPFEDEIIEQWEGIQELLASEPSYNIRNLLASRRSSPWYQESKAIQSTASQPSGLCGYGEESGLSLLLSFSRASIKAAESADQAPQSGFLANALSVLAPLLQFIIKHRVWDANLGVATSARAPFLEWRCTSTTEARKETEATQSSRVRRKRTPHPTEDNDTISVALHAAFPGERSAPVSSNSVIVSCEALLDAWMECTDNHLLHEDSTSNDDMVALNQVLRQLRGCHTEKALEGASLNVAVATLDLMARPTCSNPFLCMQLAAFYASQAPKLGSSDKAFKKTLPDCEQCTPLDALLILARAECLQAVHFCTEAAFLCDFVASASRMHPFGVSSESGVHRRWRVVRAVAYNVSVSIRHTAAILRHDNDKPSDPSLNWQWQQITIDELKRGREECLTFFNGGVAPSCVSDVLQSKESPGSNSVLPENGFDLPRWSNSPPKVVDSLSKQVKPTHSDDEREVDIQLVPV